MPPITSTADNEILAFPVVGGGNNSGGTTEKKVADLKKVFNSRVEPDNSKVHEEAILLTSDHPGDYTVDQVGAIFSHLVEKWRYVGDPRGVNNFFWANETLSLGEKTNCAGAGDCGDFAILMSALVESIGGTTRIILAHNNTTGNGHAYTEVYLGQDNAQKNQVEDIIKWLKQEFETDKIFTNIDTNTKDVWLNLDWWPDQKGIPHPGGPFFAGDKNIVLYIRDNYKKIPLNLPEKTNKPPKLISLTSDKPSPQDARTSIIWTAEAKDPDNDQIFYKFFLNDNPVTSWVKDNTWVWSTTNNDVGDNRIEVQIRDEKYGHALPNGFDDHKTYSFNITVLKPILEVSLNQLPVINSLVPDKPSPQVVGTIITWTAGAIDPDNDQILYRFFLNRKPVTDWTSNDKWAWSTTNSDVSENQIEVQVRDGKHAGPDRYDCDIVASFIVTEAKPIPTTPTVDSPGNVAVLRNSIVGKWTVYFDVMENTGSSVGDLLTNGPGIPFTITYYGDGTYDLLDSSETGNWTQNGDRVRWQEVYNSRTCIQKGTIEGDNMHGEGSCSDGGTYRWYARRTS